MFVLKFKRGVDASQTVKNVTFKLNKEVINNKNILQKAKKVVAASLPIKNIDEIELIKDLCRKKSQLQELLMFTLAINTGLGVLELLNLKVKDIKGKHYLSVGKQKSVPLNTEIIQLVEQFTENKNPTESLFQNSKGNKVGRTALFYDFKGLCIELGLNEKYSVASWRKTFAYHYYEKYKDISYLMWLFNQHSADIVFKFIAVEENMNIRFKEGVCL